MNEILIFFLTFFNIFLFFFREWPPPPEEVAGMYVAHHGKGKEYIHMKPDYTFFHYYSNKKETHIDEGKWSWYFEDAKKNPCLNFSSLDIYIPKDMEGTAVNFCVEYNRYTIHLFPGHDDDAQFDKQVW